MQFSLFGAAAAEPALGDLDGLLVAGALWVRSGNGADDRARLSVLVDAEWRVSALLGELAERGLVGERAEAEGGLMAVRTAFLATLVPAAERWTHGARIGPPADLVLSAMGLRLWTIATGHRDELGFLLGTPAIDTVTHRSAGAQLAALGIAAVAIGERSRPGWRLTGAKRLRRFAELVGERPSGCGMDWPS